LTVNGKIPYKYSIIILTYGGNNIYKLKIINDSKSSASKHLKLVEFSASLLSPVCQQAVYTMNDYDYEQDVGESVSDILLSSSSSLFFSINQIIDTYHEDMAVDT
jgi:translation initiation factor IF-3